MTANVSPITIRHTSAEFETITPDLAREYLTHNTHNRNVRTHRVKSYAEDMKAGRWAVNGEAIKFAVDGTLLDGQHRLYAIIEADVAVQVLVIRGIAPDAQNTMDTGANRRLSDILTLAGEKNTTTLASAIRGVHIWESGSRVFGGGGTQVSNPQLLATFAEHQWIRDAIPDIIRIQTHAKLPAAAAAAVYWAFNKLDAADAEHFFNRLCSDLNHQTGDPISALRRALLNTEGNRGTRNVTLLVAMTCKAWNKYRDGDRVTLIAWRPGGASPEAFPEPR